MIYSLLLAIKCKEPYTNAHVLHLPLEY